jgi:hypothetical protein
MRFYKLDRGDIELQRGTYNAAYKWKLPGVSCPVCKAIWGGAGTNYPAVDLSVLPEARKGCGSGTEQRVS